MFDFHLDMSPTDRQTDRHNHVINKTLHKHDTFITQRRCGHDAKTFRKRLGHDIDTTQKQGGCDTETTRTRHGKAVFAMGICFTEFLFLSIYPIFVSKYSKMSLNLRMIFNFHEKFHLKRQISNIFVFSPDRVYSLLRKISSFFFTSILVRHA